MTTTFIDTLSARQASLIQEAEQILQRAETERRPLTEVEKADHDALTEDIGALGQRVGELREHKARLDDTARQMGYPSAALSAPRTTDRRDGDPVLLTRDQSFTDWARREAGGSEWNHDLSMTRWVRGIVTGNWSGAEAERSLLEGTNTAGGYLVPTPLASQVIDRARNVARVFQAGATTVPMTSQTLKVGKVTGDPSLAWHAESDTITPTDMTFGLVTFTARTLPCIIKGSREVFEDADNMEDVVRNAMGAAFALELDRVALRGTGTAPEPKGVRNQSGVTVTSLATNGATPSSYDFLIDAIATLEGANYDATAIIHNPRTEKVLAKLKDSTGQPLRVPDKVGAVRRLSTNQVPIDLTHGTASDASEVYVADWSKLLIGIRHNFEVRLLTETYAETGEYALMGWLRADVQVADANAFHVNTGVRG